MQVQHRGSAAPATRPQRQTEPLVLADLLSEAGALARLMVAEVGRGRWLDSFLLAAGLCQVTDDWLHRDLLSLRNVARLLDRPKRGARNLRRFALWVRAAGLRLRGLRRAERRVQRWRGDLAGLVEELAAVLVEPSTEATVRDHSERVLAGLDSLPAGLARSVVRLPSCFRSLDQRTEDCEELARRFARRRPDRARPLLVVGLRTSGSYLAPLEAAHLRRLGYPVQVLTVRPGQDLHGHERALLRAAAGDRALVLLCDDPPASGRALAEAAAELCAAGIRRQDLTLLLALLGPLPGLLAGYDAVTLPADQWRIERLLEPPAVRSALGAWRVDRLPLDEGRDLKTDVSRRRHARALYRVTWPNGVVRRVYAKGLGLGYFGHHALAVTEKLSEYLPETLAVADGILFREWLPDECRLRAASPAPRRAVAERIAAYVADRAARLPAVEDRSLLLVGRQPLWQRVSDRLGRGFGGVRPLVRPALHRLCRRLLAAPGPSIVDGSLALAEWFHQAEQEAWLKVDYDERAFSNEDLHVYDPVWDLAVAAADAEMEGAGELAALLRDSFVRRSGRTVDDVRWLLYRLQYLAGFAGSMRELLSLHPDQPGPELAARDALAAAEGILLEYLGSRLVGDLEVPASGRLCAIDIDGVLETAWLGFSSITPLGVLSLRTLCRHGHRPVLATGRSLGEVAARCRALRLAGGVAEYGAAAYDARDGSVVELLDGRQRLALERGRRALAALPGVHLDGRWERTLRAFRIDACGTRCPLPPRAVESVRSAAGGRLQAVQGWRQTDFVPLGVDKGTGLRALVRLIAPEAAPEARPLALAVGDTEQDLPMFALTNRGWAPANARPAVRSAGVAIASRRFQGGLAEAVASLVGHAPGGCPRCRTPRGSPEDRLLLAALAAQDAGRWRRLSIGWRLYREAGR